MLTENELKQKTTEFFSMPMRRVADNFLRGDGQVIAVPNTERKIRIAELEEFPRVGTRWNKLKGFDYGTLWNPAYFRIIQSLVATRGPLRDSGSCLRLLKAEYFDSQTGLFVETLVEGETQFQPNETDISRYLGLARNDISKLSFLDDSDNLYLQKLT